MKGPSETPTPPALPAIYSNSPYLPWIGKATKFESLLGSGDILIPQEFFLWLNRIPLKNNFKFNRVLCWLSEELFLSCWYFHTKTSFQLISSRNVQIHPCKLTFINKNCYDCELKYRLQYLGIARLGGRSSFSFPNPSIWGIMRFENFESESHTPISFEIPRRKCNRYDVRFHDTLSWKQGQRPLPRPFNFGLNKVQSPRFLSSSSAMQFTNNIYLEAQNHRGRAGLTLPFLRLHPRQVHQRLHVVVHGVCRPKESESW